MAGSITHIFGTNWCFFLQQLKMLKKYNDIYTTRLIINGTPNVYISVGLRRIPTQNHVCARPLLVLFASNHGQCQPIRIHCHPNCQYLRPTSSFFARLLETQLESICCFPHNSAHSKTEKALASTTTSITTSNITP